LGWGISTALGSGKDRIDNRGRDKEYAQEERASGGSGSGGGGGVGEEAEEGDAHGGSAGEVGRGEPTPRNISSRRSIQNRGIFVN
jgi:hypothetical protein